MSLKRFIPRDLLEWVAVALFVILVIMLWDVLVWLLMLVALATYFHWRNSVFRKERKNNQV